ncbi:hypothetical protein D3C85_1425310 [compost metagenome]
MGGQADCRSQLFSRHPAIAVGVDDVVQPGLQRPRVPFIRHGAETLELRFAQAFNRAQE